ncbi:MAG: pyridoxal 5'-phosphate synthase glutaminase subunit PdxT [Spirochaetales bacterium]|nr:pyridoxal 5'-phosphate synthase glutaminase subunit PdxT [Spirochaetales bacterium]
MNRIVGILALQGGFSRHAHVLASLGVHVQEVRTVTDLAPCTALIIPGGESTVLTRHLMRSGTGIAEGTPWEPGPLYTAIQDFALRYPVMGTCAGLIMLCMTSSDERVVPLQLLSVTVQRNGWGRQTESCIKNISLSLGSNPPVSFPATFIRAPRITAIGEGISVLASIVDTREIAEPVMVQQGGILGLTFHPELASVNPLIHRYFLSL